LSRWTGSGEFSYHYQDDADRRQPDIEYQGGDAQQQGDD
jgi:hypothetical protein